MLRINVLGKCILASLTVLVAPCVRQHAQANILRFLRESNTSKRKDGAHADNKAH
jgi:hypothetical protein